MPELVREASPRRPLSVSGSALFLLGCAVLIAPLWIVRYPPLLDYPNHLASSYVLAHLHDPRFQFSRWYQADWTLSPYVATDALLVMLQRLFPVEVSGRIVLSLCVVALPLSVSFFIRQVQVRPSSTRYDLTVPWAFVMAYNIFFLVGFLQYCLSIAGCFAVLGIWLRYLDRPTVGRWVGLFVAAVILYFTHLFGFAAAALIMTLYALPKRLPVWQLGVSWLVFLPGVVLSLQPGAAAHGARMIVLGSVVRKVKWALAVVAVHPRPSEPVNLLVFALFALALLIPVVKITALRWNREWIIVAALLFAIYCLLPAGYEFRGNDVLLDARLLPFLLIVTVAAVEIERRRAFLAAALVILLLAVRMASVTHTFLADQGPLARLARSFGSIPENARILPMWALEAGNFNVLLFQPNHFWSYGVIHRGWLSPYLFSTGVHALRLAGSEPYPPWGLWAPAYEAGLEWERIRGTYDYVWAYHLPALSPRLHSIGTLVFAEEGLEVFKLR